MKIGDTNNFALNADTTIRIHSALQGTSTTAAADAAAQTKIQNAHNLLQRQILLYNFIFMYQAFI